MNIEQARYFMIEQQIRPWNVLDQSILDLLAVVKREAFVPLAYKGLAFTDTEIPLGTAGLASEQMFTPKMEARFLQELDVKKHEKVLEIGTGSGYMAALLAHRAREVVSVEINTSIAETARGNLSHEGIHNVQVVVADGASGFADGAPFDVIVISGALPFIPPAFFDQLNIGGRLAAIVGDAPAMQAQIITKTADNQFSTLPLFETCAAYLHNALQPSRFRF